MERNKGTHAEGRAVRGTRSLLPIAVAIGAARLAMLPILAAEPAATLTAYTWTAPAKVEAEADKVTFSGFGMLRLQAERPLAGLRGTVIMNRGAVLLLETDDGRRHETRFENDRPVELAVTFPNQATGVTLAASCASYQAWSVCHLRLVFTDGSQVPLASLFVGDYHRLGPHNRLPRYGEPPTERLSPEGALVAVESDWRKQRGNTPWPQATADEMRRLERIVRRQAPKLAPAEVAERRQQLAAISAPASGEPAEMEQAYRALRTLKRKWLISDPEIDFTGILCIDVPYPISDHQTHSRNAHTSVVGGRLLVLDGLGPDAPVRNLAPRADSPAAFWRPDLSYDGKRVLFCMRPGAEPSDTFHLYEVGLDGTGWRQITHGAYDDYDPIYAPDGGIIFTTTRCNQFLPCGGSTYRMFVLARCDRDGRNIYFLSSNHESDYHPTFLPDGRILYTRWEYYDKSVSRVHCLWTCNPDGTASAAYWGNQSKWPDILWNARPVPGSAKVLFASGGHHDAFSGSLGIVDVTRGTNYPDGLYTLTPEVPWVEVGRGPEDHVYNPGFLPPSCYKGYLTPFPLSENLFLVSARTGYATTVTREPALQFHSLYLMDYDGNMELLYTGRFNILHAQPIRQRPKPQSLASSDEWPGRMTHPEQRPADGVFYNPDVYDGAGIPRGKAKRLRVMDADSRTFGAPQQGLAYGWQLSRPYSKAGAMPVFDIVTEVPVSFLYADSTKRVLGTVPVEDDGSVHFFAPPLRTLYFQLLDENGLCLQTMRSAVHVMPGEVRGCVGCHETRPVPPTARQAAPLAVQRPPSRIGPPPWRDASVSFPRFVQPVLDKHCVSCHNSQRADGGFDLSHRATDPLDFSWPYVKLVFGAWAPGKDVRLTTIANPIFPGLTYANPEIRYPTQETVVPPMTAMSYCSRLVHLATSGKHHGVKVSPVEAQQLIAWVDALCPYNGLEELLSRPDPAPVHSRAFPFPSKMMTAPTVHKAFMQDDFGTQADRIPKDADGNPLPSVYWENGQRKYRIPKPESAVKPHGPATR